MVTLVWIFLLGLLFLIIHFPKQNTLYELQQEERFERFLDFVRKWEKENGGLS